MPKVKQLEKCKHPNSRKTKALIKQIKKQNTREKIRLSGNIKLNLLGEKLAWFRDNLNPEWTVCLPEQVRELILKYLDRFSEELEQIRIKHSIGNRKNRQHASREDIINLTIKREREEYSTCGIEMPNLLDRVQFDLLRSWNGELRYLQNFKLRRFSKTGVEEEERRTNKTTGTGRNKQIAQYEDDKKEVGNNDSMEVHSKD